jgi:SAM-dependent methyltransferase
VCAAARHPRDTPSLTVLPPDEVDKINALEDTHWWYRGMREASLDEIERWLPQRPLRILDIGCGTGRNMQALARYGQVEGLDLDPLCIAACQAKGLPVAMGDLAHLQLPEQRYDLVTLFDVLNQVPPDAMPEILSRIRRALVPGGLIAFREPAAEIASGRHDLAVGIRKRFDPRFTRELLAHAGFEPLRIVHLNSLLFVPIVALRKLQLATGRYGQSDVAVASPAMNAALLSLLRFEHRLRKLVPLPFGTSLLAIARAASSDA